MSLSSPTCARSRVNVSCESVSVNQVGKPSQSDLTVIVFFTATSHGFNDEYRQKTMAKAAGHGIRQRRAESVSRMQLARLEQARQPRL